MLKEKLSRGTKVRLALAFILIVVTFSSIFAFFEMRMYYQRRENKLYLAANQAKLMEGSLDTVMARVYTLRALIVTNRGNTDFFDDAVKELFDETAQDTGLYVKNFILAPKGVVSYVYPKKGNEGLIGLDYMDGSEKGNKEAIKALKEGKLVLTNPFSLKQGGTGIAGRLPVYLNKDGKKEFWGMVAVTLDMDYLLKQFNLDYLEKTGTNYSLWYTSNSGKKVVLASSKAQPKKSISYQMNPRNLNWTLEVVPKQGWITPAEIFVGIIVILGISILCLRILETRAQIRTVNTALEQIAIKDNLTGCYSRHYVNVMLLESGTKEWKDSNSCYSLAVIDVDYFKQINDKYGHDIGDVALVTIAKILQKHGDHLRGDCVIRYGGDEFIFLMNNVSREMFEQRLSDIVTAVTEIRIPEAPDMRLSVSIGGVMGDKTRTYYELFSLADKQVYLSKEGGKNQYHLM